jgi:hypothetical protein
MSSGSSRRISPTARVISAIPSAGTNATVYAGAGCAAGLIATPA